MKFEDLETMALSVYGRKSAIDWEDTIEADYENCAFISHEGNLVHTKHGDYLVSLCNGMDLAFGYMMNLAAGREQYRLPHDGSETTAPYYIVYLVPASDNDAAELEEVRGQETVHYPATPIKKGDIIMCVCYADDIDSDVVGIWHDGTWRETVENAIKVTRDTMLTIPHRIDPIIFEHEFTPKEDEV